MRSRTFSLSDIWVALAMSVTALWPSAGVRADDLVDVMSMVPADFAQSIVLVDAAKFDKNISAFMRKIDSDYAQHPVADQLKKQFKGLAAWVDLHSPIVLSGQQGGSESVIWAKVPSFAAKAGEMAGAKQSDGLWELPGGEEKTLYVRTKGAYVMASFSKDLMSRSAEVKPSLADAMRSRMDLLRSRDLLLHINFDTVRDAALGDLGQAAQMVPLAAMMLSGQLGVDPSTVTSTLASILDVAEQFIVQVAYVDLIVGVTEQAVDLTIATGYNDGGIKTYLAAQKPASSEYFSDMEDQPFFLAVGTQVAGSSSPFFEYVVKQSLVRGKPPGAGQTPEAAAAERQAAEKTARAALDLYRRIEGTTLVVSGTPPDVQLSGMYAAANPKALFDLFSSSLKSGSPLMSQLKGLTFSAIESQSETEQHFEVKAMEGHPAGKFWAMFLGDHARLGLAVVAGTLRYSLADAGKMEKELSGSVTNSLSDSKRIKEAMATLPAKPNAVILLDPGRAMAVVGPALGLGKMDEVPPGPPVAISVSLSGEPARMDIHLPVRAIERVIQLLGSDGPM